MINVLLKYLEYLKMMVSYHLRILLDAGLVKREVIANWRHYRLIEKDILEKLEHLID